eukprot:gene27811-6490_t
MIFAIPILVGGVPLASTPYAVLQYADYAPSMGEMASWGENNIPLLDFPDININATYYFRWRLFKEHLVDYHGKYVVTEFWPGYRHDVKGNPGTISCAEGHHVAEGMWLRDSTIVDDMLMF